MPADTNREFLARDVYSVWRRRVRAASGEVVVFSPYLDRLVVRLLGNASLPASQMAVVTDLSPASGAQDYRKQLLAIRALLNVGIEVRSLPRLHAKVLLVDGGTVTIGSQNFTSYARRSREASVAPAADLSGTRIVATLRAWHRDAEIVELAFVERLLASLKTQAKAALAAQGDLLAAFEAVERAHREEIEARQRAEEAQQARRRAEEEAARADEEAARADEEAARAEAERRAAAAARRASIHRGLAHATRDTRYRSAQQTAHGRMKSEWSNETGWYQQLAADAQSDLTAWKRYDGTGWRDHRLTRLRYYPLILQPSGRMAYARVGKTVITYLTSGVNWTDRRRINGRDVAVSVDFPARDLDNGNIAVRLRTGLERPWGCRLMLMFDGQDCTLVDDVMFGLEHGDVVGHLRRFAVQAWEEDREGLLHAVFDVFRPSEVRINDHNASDYFTAQRYRLDLIEYVDRPILVATAT